MIETLNLMLIEPIVWFMQFIVSQAYQWVDSYGLAIVMLSISISTLLIPLQQWAQRWQLEDQILQQRMAPKKAEFKAVYQGQERFMMMKALYRQHHYHPIMSLKSSAGLLLQIPFFIAAYVLFTSLPLSGQTFGYIQDLSQPDALWQMNHATINILPFIMAGINLLSAVIFAKSMSSSEKYQLYGMSLLFLVVLYNAPSALVLYWICNNLYAGIKLLWQQPKPSINSTGWLTIKRQLEYVAGILCVYTLLIVLGQSFLPAGFNQEFIRTALPFFIWLPAMYGLYQLYQLLTRSSLTIQRQREPIQGHELTYVWIILIPITQYLIYNQADFTGSQIIATIFLTTLAMCAWLIGLPYLFSHLMPKKILQGALLMFTLCIAYMPIAYQTQHLDSIKNIMGLWILFFIATLLLQRFNQRKLTVLVSLVMVLNTLGTYLTSHHIELNSANAHSVYNDKLPPFKTKPNVYLLTYDSYVSQTTMQQYGIDNRAQEAYLKNQGFTLHSGVYNMGASSIFNMSYMLNFNHMPKRRKAVAGDSQASHVFRTNGYKTAGLFSNSYFFNNSTITYDEFTPHLTQSQIQSSALEALFQGMMIGHFASFEHYSEMPYDAFLDQKHKYLDQDITTPRFLYTHTGPWHSQNSGHCRHNETELFEERLKVANQEMKDDIAHIEAVDPGAIIIINGDHGPHLTKNCHELNEKYQPQEVNRLDLQDRYGSFLAIRLPHNDIIPPTKIETLADVFPQILNYLTQTTEYDIFKMSHRTLKDVSSGVYIEDGIIHGGINDNEPLFIGQKK